VLNAVMQCDPIQGEGHQSNFSVRNCCIFKMHLQWDLANERTRTSEACDKWKLGLM